MSHNNSISSVVLTVRNMKLREVTKIASAELRTDIFFVCQRLMPCGRWNSKSAPKIPLISPFRIIPYS